MVDKTRRRLILGTSATLGAIAMSPLKRMAGVGGAQEYNEEVLVVLFLRGGCDALNFIPPVAGDERTYYEAERPQLQIAVSGADAALPLDGQFGLHPSAGGLHGLFQDGKLAVVLAAGMHDPTRSHFDAMAYMELGSPGKKSTATGWMTRHMESATNLPNEILLPALAMGNLQPTSLQGSWETLTMSGPGSFNLNTGPARSRDAQRLALRHLYSEGSTSLHKAGVQTLNALDIVEANLAGKYVPGNGAVYPAGTFGNQLQVIARMIKQRIGLRISTISLYGWDTHHSQGTGTAGTFAALVTALSEGLTAFYTDLDGVAPEDYAQRLTVVVQSEFGRRFPENASTGTDHGHGCMMLVLGGNVNGGLHGTWPGLRSDQLSIGRDLETTTDYRRVLSEVLIRRMGNPYLGEVFPSYTAYTPLGVVQGADLEPVYDPPHSAYLPLVQG